MDYLKMIGKYIRTCKKEFITYLLTILGGFLFGTIIALFVVGTAQENVGYGCIGTVMAGIFVLIMLFFGQALGGITDFHLAVFMSQGRLKFLVAKYIAEVIEIGGSFALIFGLSKLEYLFAEFIAKGGEIEVLMSFDLRVVLAVTFALPIFLMLLSALYVVFEKKFFWFMWGVYMIVALGAPRITSAMKKNPESMAAKIGFFFQNVVDISSVEFIIGVVIATIIAAVADVLMYRKIEVKE